MMPEWRMTSALTVHSDEVVMECEAWIIDDIPGLAVTKPLIEKRGSPPDANEDGWTITHLDSGMEIGTGTIPFSTALNLARELSNINVDWTLDCEHLLLLMTKDGELYADMVQAVHNMGCTLKSENKNKPAKKRRTHG